MGKRLLGLALVLHGLAQTLAGMRVTDATNWTHGGSGLPLVAGTVVWAVAEAGLVAAGVGLLGARPWKRWWRGAALAGTLSSLMLLAVMWKAAWALPGLGIDAAILVGVLRPRWPGTSALPVGPALLLEEGT